MMTRKDTEGAGPHLAEFLRIAMGGGDEAEVESTRQGTVKIMIKTGDYGRMVQYASFLKASFNELSEAASNYIRNLRDLYLADPDFKNAIIAIDAYRKDQEFPARELAESVYNSITRIGSLEQEIAKRRKTPFYKRFGAEKCVTPVKGEKRTEITKLKTM